MNNYKDLSELDQLLAETRQQLRDQWSKMGSTQIVYQKLNYEDKFARVINLVQIESLHNQDTFDLEAQYTGIIKQAEWLHDYITENKIDMSLYDHLTNAGNEENTMMLPFDIGGVINHYRDTGEIDYDKMEGFDEFIEFIASDQYNQELGDFEGDVFLDGSDDFGPKDEEEDE